MKLTIDISDDLYNGIVKNEYGLYNGKFFDMIRGGTQPKIGHWIKNEGSLYCSFCGCGALYDKVYPNESVFGKTIRVDSIFCPTCGAKMEG